MKNTLLFIFTIFLVGCQAHEYILLESYSCEQSSDSEFCSVTVQTLGFDKRTGDISINGIVLDPKSKKPLQGVVVRVDDRTKPVDNVTITDAEGRFALDNLSVEQVLIFTHEGYANNLIQVAVIQHNLEQSYGDYNAFGNVVE